MPKNTVAHHRTHHERNSRFHDDREADRRAVGALFVETLHTIVGCTAIAEEHGALSDMPITVRFSFLLNEC